MLSINGKNWIDTRGHNSYSLFRKSLVKCNRVAERETYYINDSVGTKLLARLRFSFSPLREQKFRHGFKDTFSFYV